MQKQRLKPEKSHLRKTGGPTASLSEKEAHVKASASESAGEQNPKPKTLETNLKPKLSKATDTVQSFWVQAMYST